MLQKKEKLPLVAFTFSRKRCDENADSLTNLDLTEGQEKHRINAFFQKSISILKGSDRDLPQVSVAMVTKGVVYGNRGVWFRVIKGVWSIVIKERKTMLIKEVVLHCMLIKV